MRAQASSPLNKQGMSSDPTIFHPSTHSRVPAQVCMYTHTHTTSVAQCPLATALPGNHLKYTLMILHREGQPGPGGGRWLSRPWGS